jgi:hypothetical protein
MSTEIRRLLEQAEHNLNQAKGEITDPASDRLIDVCESLIFALKALLSPPGQEAPPAPPVQLERFRNVSWMHGERGTQVGSTEEWYRASDVDRQPAAPVLALVEQWRASRAPKQPQHVSAKCAGGNHGWCHNRNTDETRCQCACHYDKGETDKARRACANELEAALKAAPPVDTRSCTCHPDDNPPVPCPKRYAYSECVKAAPPVEQERQEKVGDLLAYGEEESAHALRRKDRDQYQFWQGWNAALQRLTTPTAFHRDDRGDWVCAHGTAADVHCCHCHSGFIFDPEHECPASPSVVSPGGQERAFRAFALLRRIRGWDMMDYNKTDGDYWRREIDAILAPSVVSEPHRQEEA